MVYSCCLPGCRAGYKEGKGKSRKAASGISMYKFADDEELKIKWFNSIPIERIGFYQKGIECANSTSATTILKYSPPTRTGGGGPIEDLKNCQDGV